MNEQHGVPVIRPTEARTQAGESDTVHVIESVTLAVVRSRGEHRLVAHGPFAAGQLMFRIEGRRVDRPSRYSLQVGAASHVEPGAGEPGMRELDNSFWRFMNHSCEPNVRLAGFEAFAVRAIKAGEEVTFHYATTEYELAEPFNCRCGSAACLGVVRGFRYLRPEQQRSLESWLAPYLQEKLPAAR